MAAVKTKKPVTIAKRAELGVWPRDVLIKNNSPFQFTEKVKSIVLAAHTEQKVMVSESEFMRIKHNFMQLNLLYGWDNGLMVVDSVGVENGDV